MAVTNITPSAAMPARTSVGDRVRDFLRAAGIALLGGMAGGVVWGIGARAAMRVIALVAHQRPEFSWGGTLAILLLGAFGGIAVSLPYLAVRRFVPGGWLRRGLIFGVIALLALGYLVYQSPPFQDESAATGQLWLAIALFAPLLVIYGTVVAAVYEPLDRRLLRGQSGRLQSALAVALLLLPVIYEVGIGALMYLAATGRLSL